MSVYISRLLFLLCAFVSVSLVFPFLVSRCLSSQPAHVLRYRVASSYVDNCHHGHRHGHGHGHGGRRLGDVLLKAAKGGDSEESVKLKASRLVSEGTGGNLKDSDRDPPAPAPAVDYGNAEYMLYDYDNRKVRTWDGVSVVSDGELLDDADGDDDDDDFDEYDNNNDNKDNGYINKKTKNDHEWMFFDVAKINVRGGDGGDGCMAMRREFRIEHGGPSGGNGGSGGSVFLVCDDSLNTLALLRRKVHHRAKDGTNGKGDSRHGRKGNDVHIPVPPGTIVRDQEGRVAGELQVAGQQLLVARGGKGGRGNEHFKTPRNPTPNFAELGELGHERWVNIELKLVADVGFVGVPNAGKSTLLAAASNARPKIADYPFTTVVPNLGVCDLDGTATADGKGLVLADIPGLLEGAHAGIGLGLAFLRHVQRCRAIIHVIRGDSEDPIADFVAINEELRLYDQRLASKPQVVVLNKIDIPEVRSQLPEITAKIRSLVGHSRVMGVSAATTEGVAELMRRTRKMVDSLPEPASGGDDDLLAGCERVTLEPDESDESYEALGSMDDPELSDSDSTAGTARLLGFDVITDPRFPGQFRVVGTRIERTVAMTNWDYYEAVLRFQRILDAQGITDRLKELGAKQGDLIMIGQFDFDFVDQKNRWMTEMGMQDMRPRKHYE